MFINLLYFQINLRIELYVFIKNPKFLQKKIGQKRFIWYTEFEKQIINKGAKKMRKSLDVLESMIYYWNTVAEKEKVSEQFIDFLAQDRGMKATYNENFDAESVRKVLSAISNVEPFIGETLNEGKFWTNNMWMIEKMDYMNKIISPLKRLSVEDLGEGQVVFLPLHLDLFYKKGNTLYINFFMVEPDEINGTDKLTIEDVEVKEWIKKNMG